jgi:hypothetical protein
MSAFDVFRPVENSSCLEYVINFFDRSDRVGQGDVTNRVMCLKVLTYHQPPSPDGLLP